MGISTCLGGDWLTPTRQICWYVYGSIPAWVCYLGTPCTVYVPLPADQHHDAHRFQLPQHAVGLSQVLTSKKQDNSIRSLAHNDLCNTALSDTKCQCQCTRLDHVHRTRLQHTFSTSSRGTQPSTVQSHTISPHMDTQHAHEGPLGSPAAPHPLMPAAAATTGRLSSGGPTTRTQAQQLLTGQTHGKSMGQHHTGSTNSKQHQSPAVPAAAAAGAINNSIDTAAAASTDSTRRADALGGPTAAGAVGGHDSGRPKRRTAELAVSRMRGQEASMELFALLAEHQPTSSSTKSHNYLHRHHLQQQQQQQHEQAVQRIKRRKQHSPTKTAPAAPPAAAACLSLAAQPGDVGKGTGRAAAAAAPAKAASATVVSARHRSSSSSGHAGHKRRGPQTTPAQTPAAVTGAPASLDNSHPLPLALAAAAADALPPAAAAAPSAAAAAAAAAAAVVPLADVAAAAAAAVSAVTTLADPDTLTPSPLAPTAAPAPTAAAAPAASDRPKRHAAERALGRLRGEGGPVELFALCSSQLNTPQRPPQLLSLPPLPSVPPASAQEVPGAAAKGAAISSNTTGSRHSSRVRHSSSPTAAARTTAAHLIGNTLMPLHHQQQQQQQLKKKKQKKRSTAGQGVGDAPAAAAATAPTRPPPTKYPSPARCFVTGLVPPYRDPQLMTLAARRDQQGSGAVPAGAAAATTTAAGTGHGGAAAAGGGVAGHGAAVGSVWGGRCSVPAGLQGSGGGSKVPGPPLRYSQLRHKVTQHQAITHHQQPQQHQQQQQGLSPGAAAAAAAAAAPEPPAPSQQLQQSRRQGLAGINLILRGNLQPLSAPPAAAAAGGVQQHLPAPLKRRRYSSGAAGVQFDSSDSEEAGEGLGLRLIDGCTPAAAAAAAALAAEGPLGTTAAAAAAASQGLLEDVMLQRWRHMPRRKRLAALKASVKGETHSNRQPAGQQPPPAAPAAAAGAGLAEMEEYEEAFLLPESDSEVPWPGGVVVFQAEAAELLLAEPPAAPLGEIETQHQHTQQQQAEQPVQQSDEQQTEPLTEQQTELLSGDGADEADGVVQDRVLDPLAGLLEAASAAAEGDDDDLPWVELLQAALEVGAPLSRAQAVALLAMLKLM